MAPETGHAGRDVRELSPEEKLLRAILGEQASGTRGFGFLKGDRDVTGDQALLGALDAISESFEANVGRWNSELDRIEDALSHSRSADRSAEAAR